MERRLFVFVLISFLTICPGGQKSCFAKSNSSDEMEVLAKSVIERTFGHVPGNISFSTVEKVDGCDRYVLHSDGKCLQVEGSSVVAMCKGFHDYILEHGYGIASWTGNRLDFPEKLEKIRKHEVISPFRHHLFYNVCTYGYTTPFWDWERWEKEIDWLALHGFDMPLAPIAGEAILARTWEKLGISKEGIREFFCGPAHLPWLRMGNMSALDGEMSEQWYENQIALQHQIVQRMEELGMDPVYQGFAGFVPKAIKEISPTAKLTVTKWQGLESYMLSPLDPLFTLIGKSFIEEWEKEFGRGKYYLIDSFNEMDIPFGPKGSQERMDNLRHYSETIYHALQAANPDAVWVMQGWMFGYSRNIWDPESVEALLGGVPDGKMIIIDLAVDFNNYVWKSENSWDYLSGFYNKEWIWSTVPNFGGRSALKGPLDFYLNGHLTALQSPSKGLLTGYGTSPEGIENNEVVYEIISKAGWSDQKTDLDSFLQQYTKARYGEYDEQFQKFWKGMTQSVYGNFTNNARFRWQQRPVYHRVESMAINEHYFEAIESFLSVHEQFADNPLYVADAIQYAAFYLAAKADILFKSAHTAIIGNNLPEAEKYEEELYEMLGEMDLLLESHPVLRLERWLDFAKDYGHDTEEKSRFVKEAKRIITTWAGPSLKDYSSRIWSGLIRDFYLPRLKHFFEAANRGEYVDMAAFENQYHNGTGWENFEEMALEGEKYVSSVETYDDPLIAAVGLVQKYQHVRALPVQPDGFWLPEDFVMKPNRKIHFSILSEDYVGMEGIRFYKVRGNAIKIKKIEIRSGHQLLDTIQPDLCLGGEGASSGEIAIQGPATMEGLEKEVKIAITIEGGPDSYGMWAVMNGK